MNNNKYLKYFLLIAVIGIWGAIIFRVVHGLKAQTVSTLPQDRQVLVSDKITSDSFHLNADYPDPFLDVADSLIRDTLLKISQPSLQSSNKIALTTTPTAPDVASFIQYNGLISNPKENISIAIITIHGKEYLLRTGEKAEGILVKKIKKEKVTLLYQRKLYSIGQ